MPLGDYLAGLVLLAALLGAVLAGTGVLVGRRLPWLEGAERVVAWGVVASLGILVVHLVPAMLGLLGRGSVLLAAAAWLGACLLVPRARGAADGPAVRDDPAGTISMPLALTGVFAVVALIVAYAVNQATVPSASIDYANFHMPDIVRWIQNGTIWEVASFLPDVAPGNYPNNGDVMLLSFVLPWHNDFAARVPMYAFFALTGVGVYALALRLRARRAAAIVAGSLACAIPVTVVSALTHGITDSFMLFGFAAGVLFLVRHASTGRTSDLVLGGLALGLSFGTKWYGVSAVAAVVAVWAVATYLHRRDAGLVVRNGLALAGLVTAAGGVWLLRNWIVSGNPFFPVELAPFGITIFDAPPDVTRERAGYSILDYVGQWDVWWQLKGDPRLQGFVLDGILLQWWHALAAPALLAVAGAVAAAVAALRRRVRGRGILLACAAALALFAGIYSITPYTAGGPEGLPLLVGGDSRYVVPALLLAAVLAAWVAGRWRRGAVAFAAVGLPAIAHGIYWASKGELSGAEIAPRYWAAALAVLGGVGLVAWALEPWWPRIERPSRAGAAALAAGAAVVLAFVVAGGHAIQREFNDDRYIGSEPAVDAVLAAGEGQRVGLAGVWSNEGLAPVLPAFGPRFENEVEYVGPVVDEMRRRFESPESFRRAVDAGEYDFLIVGRGRREVGRSPELGWATDAGWRPVAGSQRLVLLERN